MQNNLDVREEYGCRGRVYWRDGYAYIEDYGPGINMRHFLLGVTEKGEEAKGEHGEGLDLALLVLAREGRECTIRSQQRIITPTIVYSKVFGYQLLAFDIDEFNKERGTTFKIECSEEELEEAKHLFVEFRKNHKILFECSFGAVAEKDGDVAELFIFGAKACDLPGAVFSYHIKERIGNRDREIVDMYRAKGCIRDILHCLKGPEGLKVAARLLENYETCWENEIGVRHQHFSERQHLKDAGRHVLVKRLLSPAAMKGRLTLNTEAGM